MTDGSSVGVGRLVAGGGVVGAGPIVGRGVIVAVGAEVGEGVAGEAVGVEFEQAPVSAMIRTAAGHMEARSQ